MFTKEDLKKYAKPAKIELARDPGIIYNGREYGLVYIKDDHHRKAMNCGFEEMGWRPLPPEAIGKVIVVACYETTPNDPLHNNWVYNDDFIVKNNNKEDTTLKDIWEATNFILDTTEVEKLFV